MRRLLLTLALCSWAASAQAQVAFGQWATDAAAQPFQTDGIDDLAFAGTVASGSRVCVGIGVGATSRTVTSVVDDGSNTYALVATAEEAGAGLEGWIYCSKTTATMQTVTVTLSSAVNTPAVFHIASFTGDDATATPPGSGSTAASSTTHDSGTVTVNAANGAIFGFTYGTSGVYTIDADFTEGTSANTSVGTAGYDLNPATGSVSMTQTTAGSENTVNIIAKLEAAGGGGGSGSCLGTLLGVGKCGE